MIKNGIRLRNETLIIDGAHELFIANGYKHGSVKELADKVDLPKANIHYYFNNYDEIKKIVEEIAFTDLKIKLISIVKAQGSFDETFLATVLPYTFLRGERESILINALKEVLNDR